MMLPTKSTLQWSCVPHLVTTQPTIIFLHAAMLSAAMFDETVTHLSSLLPAVNLLLVDLNDHGKITSGRKNFTLWDQADDVIALMDELRIEKAIIAGLSMGGGIAMRMALSHSSRITGLVLMGTTASEGTQESKAAMIQMLDVWFSTPSPSDELMDIAIKSWGGDPDVNSPRAQQIKRHWVEQPSDPQRVGDVLMSVVDRENLLGRLHEIVVPVLIIHGEMDAIWPLEQAMDIRKGLINTKVSFEIIKGSGHLILWIRDSEDVSRMIADFVNKEILNGM